MKQTPTIPKTFLGIGYTRDRGGLSLEAMRVPVPRPAADQVHATTASPTATPRSFRDAAVLPMCVLSAFKSLYGALRAGDTVYIPGGGGGVGHLAVQMAARILGAGLGHQQRQQAAIDRHWPGSLAPITFSITSATTSPPKSRS